MAAGDFILIADAIAIAVQEATSIARISSRGIRATLVIVRGSGSVIARAHVRAPGHFNFIADAIAIGVVQASPSAIIIRFGVITVPRICCSSVVIAGRAVLAAGDFILIADAIAVNVIEAVPITSISCGRKLTRSVITRCEGIEVACFNVAAA